MKAAFESVKKLSEENLSAVIYCVSATTGRIEEIEKELIKKIAYSFVKLKVMIVLTMCYEDDIHETIDEIETITKASTCCGRCEEYFINVASDLLEEMLERSE